MVQSFERQQNIKKGIFYGIISAFSFAVLGTFVKEIGNQIPTSQLIFFRFFMSLIILIPWLITDKEFSFKIQKPLGYIFRIVSALMALFLLFYTIKYIPLIDALLLNNTAPLFVPLIVWLRGIKTPKKSLIGLIFGLIGVGIILKPGNEIFRIESLIALASGFFSALAIVQLRLISKSSSIKQMLFYYFFISTLISAAVATLQWQSQLSTKTWLLLLGVGVFGTLYQVFSTLSYVTAPVRLMSSLIFLAVIFAGFFDWIIWGHVPDIQTVFGAILIIIGAIITIFYGRKILSNMSSS
ncbi:MAG: DMT family transporter [Tatlockia sp.]|nr:DMT family transporter [Tatlockia sp.]